MKKITFILFSVLCLLSTIFILNSRGINSNSLSNKLQMPRPVEGEENEKLREQYNELRHKAASGISWKDIENQNMLHTSASKTNGANHINFANGNVNGIWFERGARNITGSLRSIDYVPAVNTLYTISNGGSLWNSVIGSGTWTLLNQIVKFEPRVLRAFTKTLGGVRLLLASGINVYYSDDNGQTLNPATGITFPIGWVGNYIAGIYRLNDGSNTIYCLTRPWSDNPWGARFRLYRSTNEGQSYTQVIQFDAGDDLTLSVCNPYNSTSLFVTDVASSPGNVKTYSVSGGTATLINTFSIGGSNTKCTLKSTFVGGVFYLYLMVNNNKIYLSTDLGASWNLQSNLSENAWDKMNVSMNDPARVNYGGVNAYRSSNSGASFTKVNDWSEYYNNTSSKLHADIMEIEYFKKTDNSEFAIVNCHGGTFISYDNLLTVSNLSLATHIAVELYDVITDTFNLNRVFAGSQDQGLQRTLTATTPGIRDFTQVISGDYGQLSLTNNNNFLWPQYPGGTYYLYTNLGNGPAPSYIGSWTTPGTQKPNYGWMLAATATANVAANEIWLGGGNLTGAGGSYLIKATLPLVGPYTVTATQFPYNFRANSNSTNAGITAIEQSLININKLFVGTEDGTFFYSNDLGLNWNKTAGFSGPTPWYLYGSCILASKLDENLVWYCGSGYSNPAVYKSTNGGVSFTPMSTGLPPTLVNEIVATPDERYLFAATEAGPYVYVVSDNIWYSLADNSMPTQSYTGVEYIRAENTFRFSTMGRGIWDFKITSLVPVSLTNWQAQKKMEGVLCSWKTEQEINSAYFILERSVDRMQFLPLGNIIAAGNSTTIHSYAYLDKHPALGTNYYRLRTVDMDRKESLSSIISVKFDGSTNELVIYPNPAKDIVFVEIGVKQKDDINIQLYDALGRIVLTQKRIVQGHVAFSLPLQNILKGQYFLKINGKHINETRNLFVQ